MTSSPSPDRRAIGVLGAYAEGWRRVLNAPAIWIGLFLVGILSAATPTLAIRARLTSFSMPGNAGPVTTGALQTAVHLDYAIPHLIDPWTLVVDVLQTSRLSAAISAGFFSQAAVWLFLWGGVLDRLARANRVGSAAFFGACGGYFWRFLRLAVPIAIAYWVIDRTLEPFPIFELVALVVFLAIVDFARVRMIVEDRRSALSALVASMRFIRRNLASIGALTLLNLVVFLVLGVVASMAATAETTATLRSGAERAQSLVAMLVMVFARLAFPASELALFQGRLAHANYTAAPLPIWPDSPAAEAIENLALAGQRAKDRGQKAE